MIATFVPNERARRFVIALLAFLLAAAFAVAASTAPAEAAKTNRFYAADIFVGNPVESGDNSHDLFVTFENLGPTVTQQAGSFRVDFTGRFIDRGGSINSYQITDASGHTWVPVSDQDDPEVVISALDGGHRIGVGETVTVKVNIEAPPFFFGEEDPNEYPLDTAGDQEDHGNFKPGSNRFTLGPGEEAPEVLVVFGGQKVNCAGGSLSHCTTGNESFGEEGAFASTDCGALSDPFACEKLGVMTVEADSEAFCDANGCKASWVANGINAGTIYLIIRIAPEDQGGGIKILFDPDPTDNNDTLTVAKNCQPPIRNTNCVDRNHPLFVNGEVYPLRFEGDPRGSYR